MSDEKVVTRTKVVRHGSFGTFILGVLMGIILVVGAVIGVGYWAYTNVSVKFIEDKTGANIPVSEEIKGKSIEKLIDLTTTNFSDVNSITLKKIEDTFGILEGLNIKIPVGFKMSTTGFVVIYDETELDENSISMASIKTTPLNNISSVFSTVATDVSNLKVNQLFTAEQLSANSILSALSDKKITELGSEIQNLKVSDIFSASELSGNQILSALSDKKVSELGTAINDLTIQDVLPASEITGSQLLTAIKSTKITAIGTKIPTLTMEDIFGTTATSSGILSLVKTSTLNTLNTDINNLNLQGKTISELETLGIVSFSASDFGTMTESQKATFRAETLTSIINKYLQAVQSGLIS